MSQQTISRFFRPKVRSDTDSSPAGTSNPKPLDSSDGNKFEIILSEPSVTPVPEIIELDEPYSTKLADTFQYEESTQFQPHNQERHNQFVSIMNAPKIRKDSPLFVDDDEPPKEMNHVAKKAKISTTLTPLDQQFVELKRSNQDKVLAIQVGYKYKFFGEDAKLASAILNIMLIPGKMSVDPLNSSLEDRQYQKYAYCSIPENRIHIHLKRLLAEGLKVGIVDQNETTAIKSNSSSKSKVFLREISKVYTTSTYIDEEFIKEGNYLICLKENEPNKDKISMVAVNIYSADILHDQFVDTFTRQELETRFLHLNPVEFILIGGISHATTKCIENFEAFRNDDVGKLRINRFECQPINQVLDLLKDHLGDSSSFGLIAEMPHDVQCCFSQLSAYLKDFGLDNIFKLSDNYSHFSSLDKRLTLDANTLKNLEIFSNATNGLENGSLIWLLDHTRSSYGARLLRKWVGSPLTSKEEILERSSCVECIIQQYKSIPIEKSVTLLKNSVDLELALSRIHFGRSKRKNTYLFLKAFNEIFEVFGGLKDELIKFESMYLSGIFHQLKQISTNDLKEFEKLIKMIHSPAALDDKKSDSDEHIVKYFNTNFYDFDKIKHFYDVIDGIENQLNDELKEIQKIVKRTNMKYLTNNSEPYLIEVRNAQVGSLPKDWIKINGTKSVSRFRTPKTSQLYKSIQYNKELLVNQCNECYNGFLEKIDDCHHSLNKIVKLLANLDCMISLAAASSLHENYTKPSFTDVQEINLIGSRNPIAENLQLSHTSGMYISNDIKMRVEDGRVAIITGPNMGGKSSFIRQVALTVIMAQLGCFIPASEGSTLGIFDSVLTRMGAQDDLMRGQSTFQVELSECSSIIRACTDKSLVLLDEVGRGTSTVDGYAIAHSILSYLITDIKPFVLFITHFQKLKTFERFKEVKNYHLGFQKSDDELIFTYKLTDGCCDRSYGIHCANLAGLSKEITTKAHVMSSEFEKSWNVKRSWSLAFNYKKIKDSNDYGKLWEIVDELD